MRLFTFAVLLVVYYQSFSQAHDLSGSWKGDLTLAGQTMDIIISFQKPKQEWTGTLSSKKRQLKGLIINQIKFENENLSFSVPLAGGGWEGKFSEDGQELIGHWLQGGFKAELNLEKLEQPVELKISEREQTPKAPFPYHMEEVSYTNKRDDTMLAATLTVPKGEGPFPAAILLTVAGPNDRDHSFGSPQHKPYMVLADHLTRKGFAVLRADDRGIGGSSGDLFQSTIEDFAHDALAGFEFLKNHPNIDQDRIGYIGNSEGSLVGPLAASINKGAAFIVTLGGIAIKGDQVILDQADALGPSAGYSPEDVQALKDQTNRVFELLSQEKDQEKVKKALRAMFENVERKGSGDVFLMPQSIEEQIKIFTSPWYIYQIGYDPAPILKTTTIPFLAINGDIDLFVTPDKNLQKFHEHLQYAGNNNFSLMKIKGVNHIMQDAKSGLPKEYNNNETSFSPRVLKMITAWLQSLW